MKRFEGVFASYFNGLDGFMKLGTGLAMTLVEGVVS